RRQFRGGASTAFPANCRQISGPPSDLIQCVGVINRATENLSLALRPASRAIGSQIIASETGTNGFAKLIDSFAGRRDSIQGCKQELTSMRLQKIVLVEHRNYFGRSALVT